MTELTLRRTDGLLTELVELVETARTLPMSGSCVVPRERVLDLLDELREVMPPEIDEARKILANRDGLLHDAYTETAAAREQASAEAETVRHDAEQRAADLVHQAEIRAHDIVEAGRAEHARLVSATGVHQAATSMAAELREQAEAYALQTRAETDEYSARLRSEAEQHAAKLCSDSDDYADRTLAELAATLSRAAATAEKGRAALAQRRVRARPLDVGDAAAISA